MTRVTTVSLKISSIMNHYPGLQQAVQLGKKCMFILRDKLDQDFSDIFVYFLGNKEVNSLKDIFHFKIKEEFSTTFELKTFRQMLKERNVEKIHSRLDITVASFDAVLDNKLGSNFEDGLIVIRDEKSNLKLIERSLLGVVKDQTPFDVCTSEDFLGTFVAVLQRIYLYRHKEAIIRLRSLYECRLNRQSSFPCKRVLSEVYNNGPVDDQTTQQNQSKMMGSKRKRDVNCKCEASEPSTSRTRSGKKFRNSYEDEPMQVELDLIKDTLHEAIALYRRSRIPDSENPFPKKELPTLTCELSRAIYAVDKRIYGCGFRNYTLEVFVNLIECSQSEEGRLSLQKRIKKVAETFHVHEIYVNFGRFDITLMSSCQVGSKIKTIHSNGTDGLSANKTGQGHTIYTRTAVLERRRTRQNTNSDTSARFATLGGFARNDEQQLFLLLSRHFADPDIKQTIFFIDSRNKEHILANVLKGQTRGIYDMSIATVLPGYIRNTRFRALSGEQMDSILEKFGPQSDVGEMPVFFWSWKSGPRRGKIAIQDFNERSSDAKLILLEDIMEYNMEQNGVFPIRMAENGHSGAIICADDANHQRVRVFTMLMGALNYKEIEDKVTGSKKQGLYMSLPVCEGIRQASYEHSQNIYIC